MICKTKLHTNKPVHPGGGIIEKISKAKKKKKKKKEKVETDEKTLTKLQKKIKLLADEINRLKAPKNKKKKNEKLISDIKLIVEESFIFLLASGEIYHPVLYNQSKMLGINSGSIARLTTLDHMRAFEYPLKCINKFLEESAEVINRDLFPPISVIAETVERFCLEWSDIFKQSQRIKKGFITLA
jgi:hypothetical protein